MANRYDEHDDLTGLDPVVTERLALALERRRSGDPYSTSFVTRGSDATDGYLEPVGEARETEIAALLELSQDLFMAMAPVRPNRRFRDHLRAELVQMPAPVPEVQPAPPQTPPPTAQPAITRRRATRRWWPFGRR